jgi:LmbE family N-acetylglucosaminyl deacetylase
MKSGLVVSAHPGDFVWRAGGAIALHAKKGFRVKIVCLAFGERGESQFAWKQPGMTLDKVKAGRKDEAERAAAALGAEIGSNSSTPAIIRCARRRRISTAWSTSTANSIRPSC